MHELTRTAANEVWGQGLYDFNRYGLAVTVEKKYSDKFTAAVFFGYHQLDFPNLHRALLVGTSGPRR